MKTISGLTCGAVLVLMGASAPAQALVMDFGSGVAATTTTSAPYSQNGLTMTPLDTGSLAGANHWDWFRNDSGATSSDWHAGIHTGNNAEEVQFVYSGGAAFDLLSILIEGIILDPDNTGGLTGTFTTSAGGVHTVSSAGLVDFTAVSGFSNITSFTFSMPLGVGDCSVAGTDCSTMMFDDVTFRQHVASGNIPEPGILALMGVGLIGVGYARQRKAAQ